MKKLVLASLVAAASLGLAACAESASDDAAMEDDTAAVEEEAASRPAEDMAAEGEMDGEAPAEEAGDMPDGPEAPVETSPSGDTDGPTPRRD